MKRLLSLVVVALSLSACTAAPQPSWGQGYETQNGYMEPDHGYFYYWMLYHSSFGFYRPQPVYHVYVAPPGYPREYRPWRAQEYVRTPSGAIVRQPPKSQSTGGYAGRAPSAVTPSRATGGYASAPAPAAAPISRTGGGYAPAAKPAPPTPSSRATGGYASRAPSPPPSRPSSRTTGGYAGKKGR